MFTATQVSVPAPTTETLPEASEQVPGHELAAAESRSGQDAAR